MGKFKSYREASKENLGAILQDGQALHIDEVRLGALLRIADSLERMERPFLETQELVAFWKKIAKEREHSLDVARRSRSVYKGMNTKLRNDLAELKRELEELNHDIKTQST